MTNETRNQPALMAYTVSQSGETAHFHRIGAAWKNSKGGYGIRLHALPLSGEIVLLPPRDDAPESGEAGQG